MNSLCDRCMLPLNEDNHTVSNDDMCDSCQMSDWEEENKQFRKQHREEI